MKTGHYFLCYIKTRKSRLLFLWLYPYAAHGSFTTFVERCLY